MILKSFPDAKILFLTTFSDDEYIIKALDIGAKGYILKQDFAGIIPALLAVEQGQSVFGGEIVSKIPVLVQQKNSFDYSMYDIGEEEQEIIALVVVLPRAPATATPSALFKSAAKTSLRCSTGRPFFLAATSSGLLA